MKFSFLLCDFWTRDASREAVFVDYHHCYPLTFAKGFFPIVVTLCMN